MSLSSLFDKIAGRQRQREQTRVNDFRSLVRAIAAGQEPDAEHVDGVLTVSGKTLDDLKQAVELYQKRKDMKAQLDTVPALDAEEAEINKRIGKAREVFDAARTKFEEEVNPLRWRREQIAAERIEAMRLPQQLVATCPYEELVERLKATERAWREAHAEKDRLDRELVELRKSVQGLREYAENASFWEVRADYLQRSEFVAKRAAEKEKQLAEVNQRIERLEKEQEAIRQEMLVP
jgi:predicted  nucleic acid-binding Zn-ribbon protein